MFEQIVEANPDVTLVRYFGRSLSVSEVDQLSDAASCALAAHGVTRGARVGLILQNVPEVIIAILAAWKLGAIIVP
ncbi:AMP-binding protein [Sphingopyxis sp. LC363]|uniref:AMP-binding protein n=1 Tax=Sphingopyxis sp. LC363 TaxID=1120705 RepID=UPI001377EE7B|nr:AMP-binding protein [Sphingopyxis sp. LC363]